MSEMARLENSDKNVVSPTGALHLINLASQMQQPNNPMMLRTLQEFNRTGGVEPIERDPASDYDPTSHR